MTAEAVILAVPSSTAAAILGPFAANVATRVGDIDFRPAATVTVAFRASDVAAVARRFDGTGYVKEASDHGIVGACTWESRRWEGTAPPDGELFRAFLRELPGGGIPGTDADLVAAARADLKAVLGIDAEPLFSQVTRFIPSGLPRYTVGHVERMNALDRELERLPGIFLAGYSYRGSGVADAVRDANRAARHAADWIRTREAGRAPA
jgi:oxygen-dependent protoporphyrinogen oxidase